MGPTKFGHNSPGTRQRVESRGEGTRHDGGRWVVRARGQTATNAGTAARRGDRGVHAIRNGRGRRERDRGRGRRRTRNLLLPLPDKGTCAPRGRAPRGGAHGQTLRAVPEVAPRAA